MNKQALIYGAACYLAAVCCSAYAQQQLLLSGVGPGASGGGVCSGGPTFVNRGTFVGASSSTTISPPLPASLVNGNLLIAFGRFSFTNLSTVSLSGTGWTSFLTINQGTSFATMFAYYIVDGAQGQPTFNWTASNAVNAGIVQYTGNAASAPIGNTSSNTAVTANTTVSTAAITTTCADSLAVNFIFSDAALASTPSGFTLETNGLFATYAIAYHLDDKAIATSGASSGAISESIASTTWTDALIEIKAP